MKENDIVLILKNHELIRAFFMQQGGAYGLKNIC